MKNCIHPEGDIHTPYGATEALPVASISASERLAETDAQTREGAGVCVGRKFPGIAWKVIRIVDGPIDGIDEIEELPPGEIGELIVSGPQVTRRYVTRIEANRTGKILDGNTVWHRMGDSGYFDAQNRFWFCGRVAHRVLTPHGPLYPIRCEAIFNRHPDVFRSALVGIGPPGEQRPIIILEPKPGKMPKTPAAKKKFLEEIRTLADSSPLTASIHDFLFHPAFPVDIRHNAKIFREKLAVWAETKFDENRKVWDVSECNHEETCLNSTKGPSHEIAQWIFVPSSFSLSFFTQPFQPSSGGDGKQQPAAMEREVKVTVKYLLYLPKDYDQKAVLAAHALPARQRRTRRRPGLVKKHGPPKLIEAGKEFPFIVVSPQCPEIAGGSRSNSRPCSTRSSRSTRSIRTGFTSPA